MSIVLSLQNISKYYGHFLALNGVGFEVPEKSIFGILGPNGSGKTTLLGVVLDVLRPNGGKYQWFGQPGSADQRKKIGSLLETPNFYHYMSAIDNLKITQSISGRGKPEDIEKVLIKVRLFERRFSSFRSFSLGMKQRLAIGAALLGDPSVIVLDEPTNGLDPEGIAEIRELIIELRNSGHTIIIASHLLDEVEKVCTHVAILKAGTVVSVGNVEDLMVDDDVVELSASDLDRLADLLGNFSGQIAIKKLANTVLITLPRGKAQLEQINKYCFENGIVLNHLQLKKKKLEARFFELTNN